MSGIHPRKKGDRAEPPLPPTPVAANAPSVERFLRLSGSNKFVLGEALATLAAASAAIGILPFSRTVQLMHVRRQAREPGPDEQRRIVAQCRWAVTRWSDRVPWRTVCFQKGLALHLMLRRRGIPSILHYGVAQNGADGLKAHVWVGVGDSIVLGGEEVQRFTRVASFPDAGQD